MVEIVKGGSHDGRRSGREEVKTLESRWVEVRKDRDHKRRRPRGEEVRRGKRQRRKLLPSHIPA